MNASSIEIRHATVEDIPESVATIVAAFITDPLARFAWPTPLSHLRGMAQATREFAGACFSHSTAYIAAGFQGAALWLRPGIEPNAEALEQVFRETAEATHLDDLLRTFEQMENSHPQTPHWYLPMIGVEPQAQCRGIGSALMRHALARCDEEHALSYLESSHPRNISLYQRHGFEVITQIQIGAGPLVTPMLRQPR